jgi:hypothetical protein
VDEKVRDVFRAKGREWEPVARETGPGKWRLDLAAANRQQLLAAGVSPERLEESGQCVACTPATFYSYRRDGGDTGRQVGFIMLRP